MSQRPAVAVIGAGFSGLLTALHLAAAPEGPTVRLMKGIERGEYEIEYSPGERNLKMRLAAKTNA